MEDYEVLLGPTGQLELPDGSHLGILGIAGDPIVPQSLEGRSQGVGSPPELVLLNSEIEGIENLLDLDGNGVAGAFSDGIMAARLASGLTGEAVTSNAVADDATRRTPEEIQAFYDRVSPFLDVDDNGVVGTFSDIIMIIRDLAGLNGEAVTSNAVAENARRTDPAEIEAYIGSLLDGTVGTPEPETMPVVEVSPANGEEMVNLTRETVVRFGEMVDPATVNDDSFFLIANGERVGGRIDVSSTEEFATFFYDEPLPGATEVRVVVNGDLIFGRDGDAIDADGDGNAGGTLTADFRTLPLTRIEGTDVFGFVFDSFNTNADGSNIPIVGATIRVDAFPEANAVTDENGFFRLSDVPAPEFSVHIDGSTADNAPEGTVYATVGKLFESVPGQETQLTMDGETFDIFLPPLATDDIQELSPTEETDVGFGEAGMAQLEALFPDVEPSLWELTQVTFPAGSAQDEDGNAATQATIIPVDPERLPAPLPPGVELPLVISIQAGGEAGFSQAGGATNFDVPAPVSFPNLEGLAPGEKSLIWSFNHDSGDWEVIGTGTVSDDGLTIDSDPGVGILAPGWHGTQPGVQASGTPGDNLTPDNQQFPPGITPKSTLEPSDYENLAPEIVDKLDDIVNVWDELDAPAPVITSANGDRHRGSNRPGTDCSSVERCRATSDSKHYTNEAIDLRGNNVSDQKMRELAERLQERLGDNYDVEAEFFPNNPPNDHIHVEYDPPNTRLNRVSEVLLRNLLEGDTEAIEVEPSIMLGDDYVLFRLENGLEIRTRSSDDGLVEAILPPNEYVELLMYDPETNHFIFTDVFTGVSGGTARLFEQSFTDWLPFFDRDRDGEIDDDDTFSVGPTLYFSFGSGIDTDGDGLLDDAEQIIGTLLESSDSDGDGINDLAEIQQGLDPLGGRAFPTGIISSLPLQGEAKAVVVEGSPLDAQDQTAYVATGSHGLAIVDASQFDNPIVLGQLDLPGDATDVAVDANLQIAAVASNSGGLQLVDVSDPMLPTTSNTVNISANQVEIADGIAYATVGSTLRAVDLLTGEELQSLTIPGSGTILGLAREGTKLYSFGSGIFSAIDIANEGVASVEGQLSVGASNTANVFAGNGVAYLTGGGFRTIDVSDPSTPSLISDADLTFTARGITANGSGLALVAAEDQGLGIYDVMDPQDTNAFVTQIDTPGFARDVAIASGIAYVADDASGLQVINYLPFDNQGVAPTVAIGTSADVDPNISGIQVVEGSSISITADVVDDVQVRNVELLVNGEVVGNDVSFPFDLAAVAPNIVAEVNTADIQVRATDTGGNSTLSNVLTLDLLEDTFAPEVVSTTPTDGSSQIGVSSITVRFNEAIDTSLVNLSGMTLTNLGIDGVLGGGDDSTVNLNAVEIPSSRRLTIFPEDLPDEGQYQLEIDSSIIADRAGNFIEAPFTLEFASSNIFTFTDFTDLSAFSLNGATASINSTPVFFNEKNVLRLTNGGNQGGSAFLIEPIPIEIQGSDASFSTAFQFQLTDSAGISDGDGSGADGFTFAISSNPSALGVIGNGIGYSGISPSVAVEFDTFGFLGGENGNHVGVNLNGSLNSIAIQPVATRMNNGAVWYTWIDYNGENNLLEVRLSETETRPDTALLSETIDIVDTLGQPEAFIGFTSATAAASNDHDIRFWEFQIIS